MKASWPMRLLSALVFVQLALAQAAGNSTVRSNSTVASNSTSSATKASTSAAKPKVTETQENWRLSRSIVFTWITLIGILMIYVFVVHINRYIRTVACLTNDSQRFFNEPTPIVGQLKKHLFDAPLFRKRHHREFRISRAVDMGTLPSRAQTLFLAAYTATIILLTTYHINYSASRVKVQASIMKRTGHMALINMLPLFLLAGRNNPLIKWTGITFDTYNQIHRWLGRIVAGEILVHGVVYVIKRYEKGGWASMREAESWTYIEAGTVAGVALVMILITSPSPVRHAFYETFLHVHFVLAFTVLVGVWIHLNGYAGHRKTLKGVIAIWAMERSFRLLRILYRNIGKGGTRAEITALPGDAVRIKLRLARPWTFHSGQHAYVYLPSIGWWTSHPFSVAWSDEEEEEVLSEQDSLPNMKQDILKRKHSNIYFIVRRRTGFTEKLWRKAATSPGGVYLTKAFVEGPYNAQRLHSYGTVLLFASGIGITHQVPHLRELVRGYSNGTVAARKVVLVWVIQTPEHLEWIREWMTIILGMPRRREVLKVLLFVTRPKNTKEIYSPSSSVQMFPGKPDIQAIVDQEVSQAIGAVGVSVCGVGAVADDVRKACRSWMDKVNIDFEEESFSW